MDKYNELLVIVETLKNDFEKFYDKGNSAAGTRVRQGMQVITNHAKSVRKDVSDIKNQKL